MLQDLAARIDADALAAGQPPPGTRRISSRATTSAASTSASCTASRVTVANVTQHGDTDTYTNPLNGAQEL